MLDTNLEQLEGGEIQPPPREDGAGVDLRWELRHPPYFSHFSHFSPSHRDPLPCSAPRVYGLQAYSVVVLEALEATREVEVSAMDQNS